MNLKHRVQRIVLFDREKKRNRNYYYYYASLIMKKFNIINSYDKDNADK
jgi:hypothetical protein